MVYPWQSEQWQQLQHAKNENRMPHALLLAGMKGIGKGYFADCFVRAQLCAQSDHDQACRCHVCRLFAGRAHPNVLWIEPEKAGQAIKVDQIREVSEFINQTSLQGQHRFVIINPANAMNMNAANALLKTLEEPSSGSMLILIADQLSDLPATILSRCQRVFFATPDKQSALAWLKNSINDETVNAELILALAKGAPLAALTFLKDDMLVLRQALFNTLNELIQKKADPLKSVSSYQDIDIIAFIDFMLVWVMDVIKLQLTAESEDLVNHDFLTQLLDLSQVTQMSKNLQLMEYLHQLRVQICTGINFNKQLMMENILVRWMECANVSR